MKAGRHLRCLLAHASGTDMNHCIARELVDMVLKTDRPGVRNGSRVKDAKQAVYIEFLVQW